MRSSVKVLALAGVVVLSIPGVAMAQEEPSAADISSARALGQEGVKLADAGNCAEAIDKLARSEKLYHAPTTLTRLGECQIQTGKLVDGTESLNRVVRESLAPNAPPAYRSAQERAQKLLETTKPKIAKLKIAVAGPADVTWAVTVDGAPVPLANLNMNRPTDPGEHVVEATAPGYKTARAKITLTEGATDSVALTLEPDPNAPKPKPEPVAKGEVTRTDTSTKKAETTPAAPNRVPAYVALGVGVAGVAVGSIFGLMATSKESDLDSACPNKQCGPEQQDDIDTGKTFGTVSTVGFIVGGVGLVAGAALYILAGPSRSTTAKKPGTPYVGVNTVGLTF